MDNFIWVIIGILILGIAFILVEVALRLRYHFRQSDESVPVAIRDFVCCIAVSAIDSIRDRLQALDPEAKKEEIVRCARKTYKTLPRIVIIRLKNKAVPIPVQLLFTEEEFIWICNSQEDQEKLLRFFSQKYIEWLAKFTRTDQMSNE